MLLKKIIKNLTKEEEKIKIKGLSINSKKVKKGFIFFAIKGKKFNGEKFISEAVKKGAAVIVCSKKFYFRNNKKRIKLVKTSNVRYLLSKIASNFYNLKPKNIIAVTGTNGKTSVADLFYQILDRNNIPVASIGTLGVKIRKKIIRTELTSPDTIDLHRILYKIKKKGIENVIIEASSHGLDQKRIEHLRLKAGVFTNFTQDHLDYHKNMKSYLNAKLHLFKDILRKNNVVISDNTINEFKILKRISKKRGLRLVDIRIIENKILKSFGIKPYEFQLKNLSMAAAAARLCGLSEKKIFKTLKSVKNVEGRLELVKKFPNQINVYVDFAHTPDALLKVLNYLKIKHGKNISLVFGCGGDRDYKKRPKMAQIASLNCKKIYVTDDNPRKENPQKIRNEIIKNLKKNNNFFEIGDRAKAIKTAILNAEQKETILVAGKGHESEQIYKNKVISFSDKKIIKNIKLITKKTKEDLNFSQNKEIIQKICKNENLKNFHGLAIDSRIVKKGNLFLTIKGKKNDGKDYISQALKKGARHILSSKKINKFRKHLIKVDNEIKFLNNFASMKRNKTNAKVFAITGSAGKTSLKNLINDLLRNYGKTVSSPKSYNNRYGVPLSLSNLHFKHEYGVFEVGMSKKGEIHSLSKLIKPDIGIITNIGEAHIENFRNLKSIADAKGEIINNIQKGGTLILNRDDKYFKYLEKKANLKNLKVISFGFNSKSDILATTTKKFNRNYKLGIKTRDQILKIKVKDLNVYNILASIALLKELKLDLKKVVRHFKYYQPSSGRGKIHKIKRYNKNFNLIDESYNANPLSVKNAIKNFSSIKKNNFKKYLLLGDMLELGGKSEILHKDLSKVINNSDIDKVFIKGPRTLFTYKNIDKKKRGNIFQQEEDVDFILNDIIANNDYLMIKGSNATGLNNLSKRIIKGY